MTIPQEYIIQKFYQFAGYPKFKKITNVYEGGCPTCREGKSWGRKRRLYFIVQDNVVCCHNCGIYTSPVNWVQDVAGITYDEVLREIRENDYGYITELPEEPKVIQIPDLPQDSINLFDKDQVTYYNDDVTKKALKFISDRRLDKAINKPKTLWLSKKDYVHKNRVTIPFYENNDIIYYQSRGLLKEDLAARPKYLSKMNGNKSLFNFNNIDNSLSSVYIFEGPIDAFFVKNSVAVGGIQENTHKTFTEYQSRQINKLMLMNKIWVLDSQWTDTASYNKTKKLIEDGQTVFIWPKTIGKQFKDFNDMTIRYELDEISTNFVDKHSHRGLKARTILSQIR